MTEQEKNCSLDNRCIDYKDFILPFLTIWLPLLSLALFFETESLVGHIVIFTFSYLIAKDYLLDFYIKKNITITNFKKYIKKGLNETIEKDKINLPTKEELEKSKDYADSCMLAFASALLIVIILNSSIAEFKKDAFWIILIVSYIVKLSYNRFFQRN